MLHFFALSHCIALHCSLMLRIVSGVFACLFGETHEHLLVRGDAGPYRNQRYSDGAHDRKTDDAYHDVTCGGHFCGNLQGFN